jgi:chromosome segregation ATPase
MMLNLEQIRALESRVEKAVVLITKLRQENADLEARLADVLRSAELLKNQKEELERQLAAQTRAANESSSRLEGLIARAKEAEEKAANAELKAA